MTVRKKKKRRRPDGTTARKGGAMIGMRSGFKRAAHAVAGPDKGAGRKKGSLASTAITVILVLATIAILFYRNR